MAFRLDGTEQMRARLMNFALKHAEVVKQAMHDEAKIEMTESQRRVPVLTGDLKASGKVSEPKQEGRNVFVALSYGGPDSPAQDYAVVVHEDLEAFHPVGQAKYLESVLNESKPYMLGRIARRVRFDKVAF